MEPGADGGFPPDWAILRPEQVAVLGGHTFGNTIFASDARLGRFHIVPRCASDAIGYETIYRFKGLEADCVIVTGVGRGGWLSGPEHERQLLYVAASRAKHRLYVLYRPGSIPAGWVSPRVR